MLYSCESEREFNTYLKQGTPGPCTFAAKQYQNAMELLCHMVGGREAGRQRKSCRGFCNLPHAAKPCTHLPEEESGGDQGKGAGKSLTPSLWGQGAPHHVGELLCSPLLEGRVVRRMARKGPAFQEGSGFHPSCSSLSHTLKIRS